MKKILMIGTGGTIASEMTESGLAPELSAARLLAHIPGISEICHVDCVQLLNLDSTNMQPKHWQMMARCIRKHYGEPPEDADDKRRMLASLARYGYSFSEIQEALRILNE